MGMITRRIEPPHPLRKQEFVVLPGRAGGGEDARNKDDCCPNDLAPVPSAEFRVPSHSISLGTRHLAPGTSTISDVGFIRAFIVLHRAYRDRPLPARLHIMIRFLTCPFLRIVKYVPQGAKILDIGAGHGVFSVLAKERGAHPTAVDPDIRK